MRKRRRDAAHEDLPRHSQGCVSRCEDGNMTDAVGIAVRLLNELLAVRVYRYHSLGFNANGVHHWMNEYNQRQYIIVPLCVMPHCY